MIFCDAVPHLRVQRYKRWRWFVKGALRGVKGCYVFAVVK